MIRMLLDPTGLFASDGCALVRRAPSTSFSTHARLASALLLLCGSAHALQPADTVTRSAEAASITDSRAMDGEARTPRVLDGPPTKLAFKSVTVDQIVPFIVEATGKVVMPQQDVLSRKVTVLNDKPIPREMALDLVFLSLQQNGIAVVEHENTITLRDIAEVTKQDVPVLGPDQSVLSRNDLGTIVEKVHTLRHVTAKKFGDTIKGSLPDYAKLTMDEESNQISIIGSVSLQKRIEKLVKSLDRAAAGALVTETFRLRYADAEQIKANIEELFGDVGDARRQAQNQNRNQFRFGPQQQEAAAPSNTELRVTASTQQNAITVAADPVVMAQIKEQIETHWDRPLAPDTVVPRIYDLKNSDPVKVAAVLEGTFGRGGAGTTGRAPQARQGQPGQQGTGSSGTSQGVGRLAGQFSFQAIPEAGRLLVVAKSPDNMSVIDKIIEDLDQPQTVGLPAIVELKHASAEDLAEQLNALLATDGTLASIRRSESGLSATSTSGSSPFSQASTTTANTAGADDTSNPATISFWWQRQRAQTTERGASNLVGKLRIVPVWRQNALMVIAPPEYKNSIVSLITELDRPGRQVLLSAIICEISGDDALQLGLRWSSQNITPTTADNSISIGNSATGTNNNFASSLFDTSVLNTNVNVNLLLQALSEKTKVNIMSEPKIFTSDNQEAKFFDGQDIPFITQSQPNTQGNIVQSFDYKAVGIRLSVRPRITVRNDVDLRVDLELSSIVPGQTLFGGAIVDRRQTTTQLIVNDQQTIVISGILRNEETQITRKIPLLGDIPLLGELFKSRDNRKSVTELLVFITPVVIVNPEDMNTLNRPYNNRIRERREKLEGDLKPELKPAEPPAPDAAPRQVGATETQLQG